MRIPGWLAAVLLLPGLPSSAPGQPPREKGGDGPRQTITVTGTGTVRAVADTARISFVVKARGDTAVLGRDALQTNVRKFREELAALKLANLTVQAGPVELAEGQMPVDDDGPVAPGGRRMPRVPQQHKVFQVSRTFRVTLKREGKGTLAEQADRVVMAAAKGGASFSGTFPGDDITEIVDDGGPFPISRQYLLGTGDTPGRLLFSSSREQEYQRKALDLALADALAKAERVADKTKGRIVRVLEIREQPGGFSGAAGTRRPGYDAVTGEHDIVVGVTVTCAYTTAE
jgi:uncharacterized protein YggE